MNSLFKIGFNKAIKTNEYLPQEGCVTATL